MCHICGSSFELHPTLFEVVRKDPLVIQCTDCGNTIRIDCQGVTCDECTDPLCEQFTELSDVIL